MPRALPVLLICLVLAGCGPKTVASMLFPTRYAVTSVVDFNDGGRVTRQTVVSRCTVIDQSDSIARNSIAKIVSERHWIRRSDGSLWVVGLVGVCRWGAKGPRGDKDFKPLVVEPSPKQRDQVWRVHNAFAYRFDDPANPTTVAMYQAPRLFDTGVDGLRISARMAAQGREATDTLRPAFPLLARVAAFDAAAAEAKKKPAPYRRPPIPTSPGHFSGYRVEAFRLQGGACPTPVPTRKAPILLDGSGGQAEVDCKFASDCRPGRNPAQLCKVRLGGLKPSTTPGYGEIRYRLAERDPALVQQLYRKEVLAAAGAPHRPGAAVFNWHPQVCLDGVCLEPDALSIKSLYYPADQVLVEIQPAIHSASEALFGAVEGPTWSGFD